VAFSLRFHTVTGTKATKSAAAEFSQSVAATQAQQEPVASWEVAQIPDGDTPF